MRLGGGWGICWGGFFEYIFELDDGVIVYIIFYFIFSRVWRIEFTGFFCTEVVWFRDLIFNFYIFRNIGVRGYIGIICRKYDWEFLF